MVGEGVTSCRARTERTPGYHPADSAEAIAHLEKLRAEGGKFLLLPSSAFRWLEHYGEFRQHLERRYRAVAHQEDTCMVFALREPETERRQLSSNSEHVRA
jgi:hypothetical protein